MVKEVDPGELSEQAWAMLKEAMTLGTMTLPGGRTMNLDPKDFVRVVQWLATQKAKKPKVVATAEDFGLQQTES